MGRVWECTWLNCERRQRPPSARRSWCHRHRLCRTHHIYSLGCHTPTKRKQQSKEPQPRVRSHFFVTVIAVIGFIGFIVFFFFVIVITIIIVIVIVIIGNTVSFSRSRFTKCHVKQQIEPGE